jgi:hypothetical protein
MGIIHPVFSYCGEITVSFTSCREMIPDPDFYAKCIEESFEEMLAATKGKHVKTGAGKRAGIARDAVPAEVAAAEAAALKEKVAAKTPKKAAAAKRSAPNKSASRKKAKPAQPASLSEATMSEPSANPHIEAAE